MYPFECIICTYVSTMHIHSEIQYIHKAVAHENCVLHYSYIIPILIIIVRTCMFMFDCTFAAAVKNKTTDAFFLITV